MRAARADVDLDGGRPQRRRVLRRAVAPAPLCAVVKADGYGHGAIAVERGRASPPGPTGSAVALVEEGAVLRKAGIEAPILLLSQPRLADLAAVGPLRPAGHASTRRRRRSCWPRRPATRARSARVHLKVDTGMNRVGRRSGGRAGGWRSEIERRPELELEGVFTHCAVADEPDNPFTDVQLDRFEVGARPSSPTPASRPALRHAANSATAIVHPRGRYDLVRAGISVYGIAPAPALAGRARPAPGA